MELAIAKSWRPKREINKYNILSASLEPTLRRSPYAYLDRNDANLSHNNTGNFEWFNFVPLNNTGKCSYPPSIFPAMLKSKRRLRYAGSWTTFGGLVLWLRSSDRHV